MSSGVYDCGTGTPLRGATGALDLCSCDWVSGVAPPTLREVQDAHPGRFIEGVPNAVRTQATVSDPGGAPSFMPSPNERWQRFMELAGAWHPLPGYLQKPGTLVLIDDRDSSPGDWTRDALGINQNGQATRPYPGPGEPGAHALGLARAALELACGFPSDPQCPVRIEAVNAFTRPSPEPQGDAVSVAEAIERAVDLYWNPSGFLVLNISLGMEGGLVVGTSAHSRLLGALAYARCHGAVIVAASGNNNHQRVLTPQPEDLLPAGQNAVHQGMGGSVGMCGDFVGWSHPHALFPADTKVLVAAGLKMNGEPLYISRLEAGATIGMIAEDAVPNFGTPGQPLHPVALTGTSVASLTLSAGIAALASFLNTSLDPLSEALILTTESNVLQFGQDAHIFGVEVYGASVDALLGWGGLTAALPQGPKSPVSAAGAPNLPPSQTVVASPLSVTCLIGNEPVGEAAAPSACAVYDAIDHHVELLPQPPPENCGYCAINAALNSVDLYEGGTAPAQRTLELSDGNGLPALVPVTLAPSAQGVSVDLSNLSRPFTSGRILYELSVGGTTVTVAEELRVNTN